MLKRIAEDMHALNMHIKWMYYLWKLWVRHLLQLKILLYSCLFPLCVLEHYWKNPNVILFNARFNLIFGCTPSSLPITINKILAPLNWSFWTVILISLHRCLKKFRSILSASPFRTLHGFVSIHLWCFLKEVWGHCLVERPMTYDVNPDFWHWAQHCYPKSWDKFQNSWFRFHS